MIVRERMTKFLLVIVATMAVLSCTSAFHMPARAMARSRAGALFSEPNADAPKASAPTPAMKKSTELAVVNNESITGAAGVTGSVLGFVLGGPIGSLLFGALALYVSKKDNEGGDAVRGIGKSVVETYNYFTLLNNKYDVTGSVSSKVGNAFEEASASSDSEVFESIKGAVNKAKEIDSEYDLVGKSAALATASATLAEAAIEKVSLSFRGISYISILVCLVH